MEELDTIFSIPPYRLRDVPETIERYDENFWRNGHEVALFVFDDSSLANHEKYYSQLGKTRTANPLYYVGPREKERFIQILLQRVREPKLEALVRNLFRPSYGGNRNFTLMHSLGAFLVSSDDDMRPSALIEHSPESLDTDEICRCLQHAFETNGAVTANRDSLNEIEFGSCVHSVVKRRHASSIIRNLPWAQYS